MLQMNQVTKEVIPTRVTHEKKGQVGLSLSQLEERLMLLMSLTSRVKDLPGVTVKQIPMMMPSGEVVSIPGPWSLSGTPRNSIDNSRRVDDDDDEDSVGSTGSDKFVARKEFGHARLQQLLEFIDAQYDESENDRAINPRAIEVGGHCVLPPDVFEECLDKGWGCKHPFAGRYHPISGTVVPSTTLLFYSPRNEIEFNALWNIILKSYEWAKTEC